MISSEDKVQLARCIELATDALHAGDAPFGSVLVDASGTVIAEARNHIGSGDSTQHPEFEIARGVSDWLNPAERASATVYTSGEHCPMCSSAHALAGLGRIVYASSGAQFVEWLDAMGEDRQAIDLLPINVIAPDVPVEGPVPELAEQVRQLHHRYFDMSP